MNIRIAIVCIVGSMIATSIGADPIAAATLSRTSIATNNVQKCHVIDDNNKSGFDVLVHCEKKQLQESWLFGLRVSVTDAADEIVDVCVVKQEPNLDYSWSDASNIHKNDLRNECLKYVLKDASAHTNNIEKKKVKRYHIFDNGLKQTWEQAAESCAKRSWKLASIETEEENAQVEALLKNESEWYTGYWISGYEPVTNEGFKWKFGEKPISYTNWLKDQPNRA